MTTIFDQWQDGDVTDIPALRALLSDLREVESEIAPLEAQKNQLRDQIGLIVARVGTQEIPGLGKVLLTAPSVSVSYDTAQINELALQLTATHPEIAAQLVAARKTSSRVGSLRIEREKTKR
jgi:hypothetical protein